MEKIKITDLKIPVSSRKTIGQNEQNYIKISKPVVDKDVKKQKVTTVSKEKKVEVKVEQVKEQSNNTQNVQEYEWLDLD